MEGGFRGLWLNNQMGATTQKSLRSIVESKYSFSHPKSHYPRQLSVWKYSDEELQRSGEAEGCSMKWPYKFYSDEGYIVALIENKAVDKQESRQKKGKGKEICDGCGLLKELKASLNMIEMLYSFCHGEIEQYWQERVNIESQSKYLKDQLNIWIYVYVGQNLSSVAKLKLVSYAISMERYIARGGLCAISKLYHEYEEIADLGKEIKRESDDAKEREEEYYISVSSINEDLRRMTGNEQSKAETEKQGLSYLWEQLQKFSLLGKAIFDSYLQASDKMGRLVSEEGRHAYPQIDGSQWSDYKNLIQIQPIHSKRTLQKKPKPEAVKKEQDLNDSSPFQCEITEINFKEKKKGFMNEESNLIDDLSVLNEKRGGEFVKIVCPEEDYLILTNYSSIRDYKHIVQHNVRLIVNLAPNLSYNYYLNDIEYLNFYLAPLPIKPPADAVLFQYNVEDIMLEVTHHIIRHTVNNKPKAAFNNHIAIHSGEGLFSDENCAVVIGYLIVRYLYTFEKAFSVLNENFKKYKKDQKIKFSLHKLYVDQLLTLEGRILIGSSPDYGVALNPSSWRAYQVSNNHSAPSQKLVFRFIGQLTNLNQLTSLPNFNRHFFIVLSNQLVSSLCPIMQKWQKDPGLQTVKGLTGIKVLIGKEFEFKDVYIAKGKFMISLLLNYELVNRQKCKKAFSNQFFFQFMETLVAANLQAESIEKSFRKPVPFVPLYTGFEEETPIPPQENVPLPYNSKEKLTFKYPVLRPTWEPLKDDEYYFIVQVTKQGASVQIVKGKNWAGYEVDKQTFFASIVELYLKNIQEDKIWIAHEGEESLFQQDLVI